MPFQINPNLLDTPIVKNAIYGQNDPQFIDFMAPGIMVTIIFLLSIGLTALLFVIEKKEGLLERTAVANVNTIELIGAHVTLKLVVMVIQTAVLLAITTLLFDIRVQGILFTMLNSCFFEIL
jgi:ABC-type transport system involved in cytochrome c biogenesis permease component